MILAKVLSIENWFMFRGTIAPMFSVEKPGFLSQYLRQNKDMGVTPVSLQV